MRTLRTTNDLGELTIGDHVFSLDSETLNSCLFLDESEVTQLLNAVVLGQSTTVPLHEGGDLNVAFERNHPGQMTLSWQNAVGKQQTGFNEIALVAFADPSRVNALTKARSIFLAE